MENKIIHDSLQQLFELSRAQEIVISNISDVTKLNSELIKDQMESLSSTQSFVQDLSDSVNKLSQLLMSVLPQMQNNVQTNLHLIKVIEMLVSDVATLRSNVEMRSRSEVISELNQRITKLLDGENPHLRIV